MSNNGTAWFVFIAFQSCKLSTLVDMDMLGFLITTVLCVLDTFAAVYIIQFIEVQNVLFWVWFVTNALQTLFYEPLMKRSIHFHKPQLQPSVSGNLLPQSAEEKLLKDSMFKYGIATKVYYFIHILRIVFVFVVVFSTYSSPPAEVNVAIVFSCVGSIISCVLMELKQQDYFNN